MRSFFARNLSLAALVAAATAGFSSAAFAHVGDHSQMSFVEGLLHPFSGLDHVLAMVAVGLWASSLTQNQIVAALVCFALLLVLWLSDNLGQFLGGTIGSIVSYTSVINHFQSFPQGVIESKDVIYYLTLVAAGIVLSTLSLQSRRYR